MKHTDKPTTTASAPETRTRGNAYSLGKHCTICGKAIVNIFKVPTCQKCRHEQHKAKRTIPAEKHAETRNWNYANEIRKSRAKHRAERRNRPDPASVKALAEERTIPAEKPTYCGRIRKGKRKPGEQPYTDAQLREGQKQAEADSRKAKYATDSIDWSQVAEIHRKALEPYPCRKLDGFDYKASGDICDLVREPARQFALRWDIKETIAYNAMLESVQVYSKAYVTPLAKEAAQLAEALRKLHLSIGSGHEYEAVKQAKQALAAYEEGE